MTIFTLYADKQLTEQNSSIFPKLLALSTISAEDLRDLHSVQGVILADFWGNTEISFSFPTWHFLLPWKLLLIYKIFIKCANVLETALVLQLGYLRCRFSDLSSDLSTFPGHFNQYQAVWVLQTFLQVVLIQLTTSCWRLIFCLWFLMHQLCR